MMFDDGDAAAVDDVCALCLGSVALDLVVPEPIGCVSRN